jgi:periplasmic divalent cation tolerance protein
MKVMLVYITTSNKDEAVSLASMLLAERLVACANIIENVLSMYWWQGAIERNPEAVLMLKTTEDHMTQITARVKSEHSYQNPCIVAWPLERGNTDFLDWVKAETHHTPD